MKKVVLEAVSQVRRRFGGKWMLSVIRFQLLKHVE